MMKRDFSIDMLRGIAIVSMVAANLAGMALLEPHPIWLRIYGSFAAPLFIILAGMMVAWGAWHKHHDFKYFLRRGVGIILVGALLDVILWGVYPFTSVDILYLIGLAIPLSAYALRFNPKIIAAIAFSIFILTPFLQYFLGYTPFPFELTLKGLPTLEVANQTPIWNHWFVDGWFPLFPWLGFALTGVLIARWRWLYPSLLIKSPISKVMLGAFFLSLSFVLFYFYPERLYIRNGFSELFYPPTLAYISAALGVFWALLGFLDSAKTLPFYTVLQRLGQHSLFLYVAHLILAEYLIVRSLGKDLQLYYYLGAYAALLIILYLLCMGLEFSTKWLKARKEAMPIAN